MTIIVLAEKPAQARKYADALGVKTKGVGQIKGESKVLNDFVIITWCVGHLIKLADPQDYNEDLKKWSLETLPIIPKEIKYKISQKTSSQFKIVKEICKNLSEKDTFIIATDPDREGEAIARLVMNKIPTIKNTVVKRLWANTQEPEELKNAFLNLKDAEETYSMFLEAQARGIADWIVGINLTRLVTLNIGKKIKNYEVYSVGRVQTPTLFMVFNRNNAIKDFESKPFYELIAIDKDNNDVIAPSFIFKYKDNFSDLDSYNAFIEEHHLVECKTGTIFKVESKIKKQPAPKLFKLGGIQKLANQKWGYTLDKTLSIVQSLYDKGFLSYPRTDCDLITTSEFNYLKESIDEYSKCISLDIEVEEQNLKARKIYVDNKKVLEHYAIVPTKTIPDQDAYNAFTKEEKNIYDAVVERTLGMFQKDYSYNQAKILLHCNNVEFSLIGKTPIESGWKKTNKNEDDKEKQIDLPIYTEGQIINVKIDKKEGKTKPPSYLTEASLGGEGGLMETCSNGIDDKELKKDLKNVSGIGTPATRSGIIKGLIDKQYLRVEKKKLFLTAKGEALCTVLKDSEIASVEMTAHWEHELKCISEIGTTNIQREFLDNIKNNLKVQSSSLGKQIEERLSETTIQKVSKEKSLCDCPKCNNGQIEKKKSKKGDFYYKCSNNDCNVFVYGVYAGKNLSDKHIKELLTKNKTSIIKGFTSKAGNKFGARLKMENGKIAYDFDKK